MFNPNHAIFDRGEGGMHFWPYHAEDSWARVLEGKTLICVGASPIDADHACAITLHTEQNKYVSSMSAHSKVDKHFQYQHRMRWSDQLHFTESSDRVVSIGP